MSDRVRERLKNAAKAALTLLILAWLFRKIPPRTLLATLGAVSARDVLLLTLITVAQVTVSVARWWRLLRRLGERVGFGAVYADVLLGLTYNMFLPTTVGGDVVRALRASARTSRPSRAWSSSIYERIAGLLAMAATGALGALAATAMHAAVPRTVTIVTGSIALIFGGVFFAASAPFRLLVRLLANRLPEAATGHVRGIVEDLEGPLSSAGARLEALGWSLGYQLLGLAFCVVGARAMGDHGHDVAIVVGVPLVHVLSLAPVTIGGLGLREQLFVTILGLFGVSQAVALGLGAQWLLSSVAFALAGAAVALVESSTGKRGRASG